MVRGSILKQGGTVLAGACTALIAAMQTGAQPSGLPTACVSQGEEAAIRQREELLLGRAHAAAHAQTRAKQCDTERNGGPVRGPLADPASTVQQDAAVVTAASQLAAGQQAVNGAAAAAANAAKSQGRWSSPFPVDVLGITSVLLHTGQVLFWAYDPASWLDPAKSTGVAAIWDPATRTSRRITPPENIWCGGQTLLADGRVFVAGGNLRYPDSTAATGAQGWEGSLGTYTFLPSTETWVKQPDMQQGRWYPTTTQLGDNRVVITSGYDESGSQTVTSNIEVFTPSAAMSGVGQVTSVGTHGATGLYPLHFTLPSGQMLEAGPGQGGLTFQLDPATWNWSALPSMTNNHFAGNGISYTDASVSPMKQVIMVAGGSGPPSVAGNEWINGANPGGGWARYGQWLQARFNSNTVILPDGSLLTVGGGAGPGNYDNTLVEAELHAAPATDTGSGWQAVAAPSLNAAYHSAALLLPDATVLLTEDDRDHNAQHRAQVYSPPYLFKGTRLKIAGAPTQLAYGQSFDVTLDRTGATNAVLVAPAAVTHGNDMHQRAIKLAARPNGKVLTASVPGSRDVVPPGYYMLFVLDKAGVPSVSTMVLVG